MRNASNIVEIARSYLPLRQKGQDFWACCPFHSEKTPSFTVSPDKQIYKCFSCGASGNAFNFIMDYDHIEFKEAIKVLGEKAGVEVSGISVAPKVTKYDKYYEIFSGN